MSAAFSPAADRAAPAVDFVIAGAQKAGTTALHAFLREHPALFIPERKEIHFFDDETLDWSAPDHRRYEAWFADNAAGRRAGEATPIYMFWPPALARIAAYNPAMKLIISLRRPADRAHSHWVMERQRGHETLPFAEAIRAGRARIHQSAWAMRRFSYVERGLYCDQVRRARALFSPAQVLLVEHRDLAERPDAVLDTITDFLGVARFTHYPARRIVRPPVTGPAQDPMEPRDRQYLEDLYADDMNALMTLSGRDLPSLR